jgi:uncharacterized membrane protein YqaE (UPF0057 family)
MKIVGLMAIVLYAALGLSALRFADPARASVVFSLTVLALLLGPVAICYRRGRRRAFWVGFTLVGWGYFGLTFSVLNAARPHLATSLLLDYLAPRICASRPMSYRYSQPST